MQIYQHCIVLFIFLKCCVNVVKSVTDDSTLTGHLQPLGFQTKPTVTIDEFTLETAPTPDKFYKNYIQPSKPAVFRNVLSETNAFKLWNDEYLKKNYGNLEVRIEGKKEKRDGYPIGEKFMGRDTIAHFVDNYHDPNSLTYVVSELPMQMYEEVGVVPSLGACGDMVDSFVEIDLWWSGGNSKSVIHKDAFNQFNCLYRGVKHWKLFEYKYEKWIYKHPEGEEQVGGFSDVNITAVDLKKHPDFVKIPWSNVTINAGDCLFLPKSCYHQVDSDGPFNLAVSILFSRFDLIFPTNFSDCSADTDYKKLRPLSDFNVMWPWKGTGIMSMGFGDFEENYRYPLLHDAKELKKQGVSITVDWLMEMLDDDTLDDSTKSKNVKKAFDWIDTNKDGILSVDEIQSATFDQMRKYGELMEPYEPSNSYTFEYSYLSYWEIMKFIKYLLNSNDQITRNDWTQKYIYHFSGSKSCADEIFSGIARSNDTDVIISKDVNLDDIERALVNWKRFYTSKYFEEPNPNKLSDEELKLYSNQNNYDEDEREFPSHVDESPSFSQLKLEL